MKPKKKIETLTMLCDQILDVSIAMLKEKDCKKLGPTELVKLALIFLEEEFEKHSRKKKIKVPK